MPEVVNVGEACGAETARAKRGDSGATCNHEAMRSILKYSQTDHVTECPYQPMNNHII